MEYANQLGSQANPLNVFYGAGGSTGNKTTNKDLPEWLRKLGMKGDAYAGGMLKPQIRYGFWYKDGKINFADGTSYAAKKNKDGSFSYTDSSGSAQTYSPTDEQNAYNKKYKASTSNQSFFDKVGNTLGFELWKGKDMLKNFGVNNLFFGVDKYGVKLGNAITGRDDKPLVDEWGGATDEDFARYGKPTGFAEPLHDVAHTVAQYYAMQGLGNIGGGGSGDLGVFSNGGTGGLSGVGGGNAGALANSGALSGGAGALNSLGGINSGTGGNMGWDWNSIINTGGQLLGGYLESQGNKDASRAETQGYQAGIDEQRRQFDTIMGLQAPYRQVGGQALNTLARLYGYAPAPIPTTGVAPSGLASQIGSGGIGIAPNGAVTQGVTGLAPTGAAVFEASPDYQFRRDEGMRGIENSFAARGGAASGNALRALSEFNSGLASGEFGNFFNRQAALAGIGQAATNNSQSAAQYTGANVSNLLGQQGQSRASGVAGQTNAWTNALQGLLSSYNRNNANNPAWGGNTNWAGGSW